MSYLLPKYKYPKLGDYVKRVLVTDQALILFKVVRIGGIDGEYFWVYGKILLDIPVSIGFDLYERFYFPMNSKYDSAGDDFILTKDEVLMELL